MASEGLRKFYYKFNDYEYKQTSKERVLSGIEELDYLVKGFELVCVSIWTGLTNARKDHSAYNADKANYCTRRKSFLFQWRTDKR